jgi:hypothetical protein
MKSDKPRYMQATILHFAVGTGVIVCWLSLLIGVAVSQTAQIREISAGKIASGDDAFLDWEGQRIYFSGYSGNSSFGVLGTLGSAAKLSFLDPQSRTARNSRVFKELRKECDDRFKHLTFVGPEEFVTEYCGVLYVMNASDFQVKKQFPIGPLIAIQWAQPTKTLVAYKKGMIVVFDSNKWEQISTWPVPDIRDLVISNDGALIGLQLRGRPCTLDVRRLPNGESQSELFVSDCHPPVRFLPGGKGPTAASVQHSSSGVVLTLWDLQTERKANEVTLEDSASVQIEEDFFSKIAISPDWKWIMGNQQDHPHEIIVWDPNTGNVMLRGPKAKLPHVWGALGRPDTFFVVSGDGRSVLMQTYYFQKGSIFSVLRPQM